MTDKLAKRLLNLVLWITETYWGYNLLDICDGILENNKLTPKELIDCLSPEMYTHITNELYKKYIDISYIKKLIVHYEKFLNENKKARGSASETFL